MCEFKKAGQKYFFDASAIVVGHTPTTRTLTTVAGKKKFISRKFFFYPSNTAKEPDDDEYDEKKYWIKKNHFFSCVVYCEALLAEYIYINFFCTFANIRLFITRNFYVYMYVWPECVLFCIGMEYRLAINETRKPN